MPATIRTASLRVRRLGDGRNYEIAAAEAVEEIPPGTGSGETPEGLILAANEIMNFPSIEKADDTQPEWWEEADANATLTEVDTAGEAGLSEYHERALKVVVATANSYAYQRLTYADQPRVKSSKVVSVAVAVWSAGSVSARIRLQSSAGSLSVSSDTVDAAWTVLKCEAAVLDGTYIELRLEVDIGTAYFIPLGMTIGSLAPAASMQPRGLRFQWVDTVNILADQTGAGDPATWTDIDCTTATSNLAVIALCRLRFRETSAGTVYVVDIRRNGSTKALVANDALFVVVPTTDNEVRGPFTVILDDAQIFEYILDRTAGAGNIDVLVMNLDGYWEWE